MSTPTMTREQIERARDAGIISEVQADAMLADLAPAVPDRLGSEAAPVGMPPERVISEIGNEEDLRFLRSFSDIFITLGILLVLGGVFTAGSALDPRETGLGMAVAAAAFWAMSEYFGRVRRSNLPTLVLSIAFALAVTTAVSQFFIDRLITVGDIGARWFLPALVIFATIAVYYWRIRLPFVMAILAWAATILVLGLAGTLGVIDNLFVLVAVLMLCGATILAFALRYDMRDPERVMRFSDNAFWLHAVASPILFGSFIILGARLLFDLEFASSFELALEQLDSGVNGMTVWILVVATLFITWGLLINRRVFVISTLLVSSVAVATLLTRMSVEPTLVIAGTLLLIGGMVVFLGVGWHPARQALLRVVPNLPIFPRPTRTDI